MFKTYHCEECFMNSFHSLSQRKNALDDLSSNTLRAAHPEIHRSNPQLFTLGQNVPLHDPDGGSVLVAGQQTAGKDQVPVWTGWTALQRLLTLSEQLVWVKLCLLLVQVWVLLWVQVWLAQRGIVQGLGQ